MNIRLYISIILFLNFISLTRAQSYLDLTIGRNFSTFKFSASTAALENSDKILTESQNYSRLLQQVLGLDTNTLQQKAC